MSPDMVEHSWAIYAFCCGLQIEASVWRPFVEKICESESVILRGRC
jgi:hypothetical protein